MNIIKQRQSKETVSSVLSLTPSFFFFLCVLCAFSAAIIGCARPRYLYSFTTNVTTEKGLNVTESYGIEYSSKPNNWPAFVGP